MCAELGPSGVRQILDVDSGWTIFHRVLVLVQTRLYVDRQRQSKLEVET